MTALFDREWRKESYVEKCSVVEAGAFIKAHYLRKRPAIVMLALMLKRGADAFGCIIYSAPPKQANTRYGANTWELARVYLLDDIPKNAESWAIGQSVKYIKREHPEVECLLSYADPSVGHSGVIYRASNWTYDGMTDSERKTPRCDYVDTRTGKKYGRKGNVPPDAVLERVPRVSKHRFFLRLK